MEGDESRGDATRLLVAWGAGDRKALDEMLPLVYEELRRLAASYLGRERTGHTLQPTALVHEAYLRLIDQRHVDWRNRAQFLGVAANMMRRILVNHARDRVAAKRPGDREQVSLSLVESPTGEPELELIELEEALERLTGLDPRKARVVELRHFGGLSLEEVGAVLEMSRATVVRELRFARAWLYDAINGTERKGSP